MLFISVAHFLIKLFREEGIMFEIDDGYYLNLESGRVENEKGEKYIKLSEKQKKVIVMLISLDVKGIYELAMSETEFIDIISVLESYLDFNLNIKIKINDFIKEAL